MVFGMAGSPPITRRGRWTASPYVDVALALLLGIVLLPSASDGQGFKQPAWAAIALIELTALPLAVLPAELVDARDGRSAVGGGVRSPAVVEAHER
jgi:hypothetical protein